MTSAEDLRIILTEDFEEDVKAKQYADAVANEAKRRTQEALFPSIEFESFASTSSELRKKVPPECLIEDVLTTKTLAMLAGDAKSGKTLVTLDIALHIAAGKAWCGKKVTQVPVLYIALEGGSELPKRIRAWENVYNQAQPLADHQFILISGTGMNLGSIETMTKLVSFVKKHDVGLVVIDTWSRATSGTDENTSKEVMPVIIQLQSLVDLTGCTALVLHHAARGREGARGSTAFEASFDTVLTTQEIGPRQSKEFKDASAGMGHDFRTWGKIVILNALRQKDLPDGPIHTTYFHPQWLGEHRGRPDTLVPRLPPEPGMKTDGKHVIWSPPDIETQAIMYDEAIPEELILKVLRDEGPQSQRSLRPRVHMKEATLRKLCRELLKTQRIAKTEDGKLRWNDNQ